MGHLVDGVVWFGRLVCAGNVGISEGLVVIWVDWMGLGS